MFRQYLKESILVQLNLNLQQLICIQLTKKNASHLPTNNKKIMVLGGGPNRIGQGIEFDYCCVHASISMREEGLRNNNG